MKYTCPFIGGIIAIVLISTESFSISDSISKRKLVTLRSAGSNEPPIVPTDGRLELISPEPTNKSNPSEAQSTDNVVKKWWDGMTEETRGDIKASIVSFLFALFVRAFLFEPRFIPSLSMYPTFDIGDQLLVDKVSVFRRPYQRRDVVVFNPPEAYVELTGNTESLIKRVIAVEGDVVEIKADRKVYVNGIPQEEKYINEKPDYILPPTVVPPGMLLVLGDNRTHSFDSHVWGFLPTKNVIGRAVVKYWPPWRLGFVEGSN